jgi:hypothetical protein
MAQQIVVRAPWMVDPEHRVEHAAGPLLGEANDYALDVVLGVTGDERELLTAPMH